jgi:hypothetical protein
LLFTPQSGDWVHGLPVHRQRTERFARQWCRPTRLLTLCQYRTGSTLPLARRYRRSICRGLRLRCDTGHVPGTGECGDQIIRRPDRPKARYLIRCQAWTIPRYKRLLRLLDQLPVEITLSIVSELERLPREQSVVITKSLRLGVGAAETGAGERQQWILAAGKRGSE